jgi:L-fucose isomerase-like protein
MKQMKKYKSGGSKNIGVIMFGRKRPGFDQEWSTKVRHKCMDTFKVLGYTVVGADADAPVSDDEGIHAALDAIYTAKCEAIVIIQPSISDGQFAFTIGQRWQGPLVLWATPERPGDGDVSSCSLVGTHLWASICKQAGFPFEFVYGDGDKIKDELVTTIDIAAAIFRLKHAKVGVIGIHAPGFIDLAADPFLIARTFGLQMQSFSVPQFIDRVQAHEEPRLKDDIVVAAKYGLKMGNKSEPAHELMSVNSRFYLSLVDMMKESGLAGISLQCWPDLPNKIGQWPYFAVSRLLAEGKAISIEGDVDGAIGSIVSNFLGMGPGFLTDWLEHDDDKIWFWHPGMAPLDMCQEMGGVSEPTLGDHFNGKAPFVVDGPLLVDGPVTVVRLWRCGDRYHLTAFSGTAIEPEKKVSGNSLLVAVEGGGVNKRFTELLYEGMPHHVTLYYGSHVERLKRVARLCNIVWHE